MRIVLDTNVFVSGVFFSGAPHQVLRAWRDQEIEIVVSPEILDEYYRVSDELSTQFPEVDLSPMLQLVASKARLVEAAPLTEAVCDDPDDDKFFACADAAGVSVIVSGDRHLLKASGYQGIEVVRPRQFVDEYLQT